MVVRVSSRTRDPFAITKMCVVMDVFHCYNALVPKNFKSLSVVSFDKKRDSYEYNTTMNTQMMIIRANESLNVSSSHEC